MTQRRFSAKRILMLYVFFLMIGICLSHADSVWAVDDEPAVTGISYERAQSDVFILERDYSEKYGWFYNSGYPSPDEPAAGDVLKLHYANDSVKTYEFRKGYGFVNTDDDSDIIPKSEVYFSMHNHWNEWVVEGDNNYYTVDLLNYAEDILKARVNVTIEHSPVASITYEPKPNYLVFTNSAGRSIEGDQVTVHYRDASREDETFIYHRNEGNGYFESVTTGEKVPAGSGGFLKYDEMTQSFDEEKNGYTITYMGVTGVAEGSKYLAKSIAYHQASPLVLKEIKDSEERTDVDGNIYAHYNLPTDGSILFPEGDSVVVTYENSLGDQVEIPFYSGGGWFDIDQAYESGNAAEDTLYSGDFNVLFPDQESEHFSVGNTYEMDISYKCFGNDESERMLTADQPYKLMIAERNDDDVTSVKFEQNSYTLEKGSRLQLNYTYKPADIMIKNPVWTSDDPAIAEVDADGVVTGIKRGQTNVRLKIGKKTAYCSIRVNGPVEISENDIRISGYKTYDGNFLSEDDIGADVKVCFGYSDLQKGVDYEIADLEERKFPGKANITIRGIGKYEGTVTKQVPVQADFSKAETNLSVEIEDQVYTGEQITPEIIVRAIGEDGTIITLTKDTDYQTSFWQNIDVGTASAGIYGRGNYTGSYIASFEIKAKESDPGQGTGEVNNDTGNTSAAPEGAAGSVIAGAVKPVSAAAESNAAAKKQAVYNAAKTKAQTLKITKPKTKATAKKKARVTWKAAVGASGYEIQYGLKKNFKKAKTITVKGGTKKKATLKKLKAGKKYFVRIRPYSNVINTSGAAEKVYGKWSKTMKVKAK